MRFELKDPGTDDVTEQRDTPRLLFVMPCLGGVVLITSSPSPGGIFAAFLWTGFAVALSAATLLVVKRRVHRLLPGLTKAEHSEIARAILTPVWIIEPLRMAIAAGFSYAFQSDPMAIFRVVSLAERLDNPAELMTGLALVLMVRRIRREFTQADTALGPAKIASTTLIIIALLCITYTLTGLAALIAVASTMTFRFW